MVGQTDEHHQHTSLSCLYHPPTS